MGYVCCFLASLGFLLSYNTIAAEAVAPFEKFDLYNFSCPETAFKHRIATAIFKEFLESNFGDRSKNEAFRKAYDSALSDAKDLDRAVILRRYASSLWRIKPQRNEILQNAQAYVQESLAILKNTIGEQCENVNLNDLIIQALFDEIRISLSLYDGEKALRSAEELLKFNLNTEMKLFAYRSLTTLYFAKNNFAAAREYLDKAKQIIKEEPTDLRHEAKLLLVESKMPLEESLKRAEELVWISYDKNKTGDNRFNNTKQVTEDIILLFSIRMMSVDSKSYFDPYTTAISWINKVQFATMKASKSAKENLFKIALEMVQTNKRQLAHKYFTDIDAPKITINSDRLKQIKDKITLKK